MRFEVRNGESRVLAELEPTLGQQVPRFPSGNAHRLFKQNLEYRGREEPATSTGKTLANAVPWQYQSKWGCHQPQEQVSGTSS